MDNSDEYFNSIFDTMIQEYEEEQEKNRRVFIETGNPAVPKLSYSINTEEFADAKKYLNDYKKSSVMVSFNNVTSTQIYLVFKNNKYYTIALVSSKPGTISQYHD